MSSTSGVHHVAIGVKNLDTMKSFYRDILGFTEVFAEFGESEQEIMREVVRASRVVFSGVILCQRAGGILLELIRMTDPVPRPIRKDFRYGDIGVTKITVAVSDVKALYEELKGKVSFCSEPKFAVIRGWGDYPFVYCRDPEGNLVEFVSIINVEVKGGFGGARSIGISVTNLERSISFYQKHLGFDVVMMSRHKNFSGLVDEVSGDKDTQVRSCLLAANNTGDCMIELFEVSKPRGRSIPFSANWGDFGYLQVCFNCDDIRGMGSYGEKVGMEFLCSPKRMDGGIPEHPGEFFYGKDPDGIPIEFLFLPK
jgi:catechol 2,3-dioxygenase-like lactoylglutathione lyase family enzyme